MNQAGEGIDGDNLSKRSGRCQTFLLYGNAPKTVVIQFEYLLLRATGGPMRSVPPRGSGWVLTGLRSIEHECIRPHPLPRGGTDHMGPHLSLCKRPTRYREVVLTSWDRSYRY